MPIDREAALKTAEKLLRQGKLEGAIEQYVRLVEDQPRDWNAINALGDLYARAGDLDRAVEQFVRIADFLFTEGFLPKANALYKKALKARGDHEHTLSRLSEIAAMQGLSADAKSYLRQLARQRRDRGDQRGAAECLVRLGAIDPDDAEAKVAAARAAQALGDMARAVALLQEASEVFGKTQREAEALDALVEAAELVPDDRDLRARLARALVAAGDVERAKRYLTPDAAGDDPDLLLAAGRVEIASGRGVEGRAVLMRVLALAPDRAADVLAVSDDLAARNLDDAFACAELVVDAALFEGDFARAASVLEGFLRHGNHLAALTRLVEVCVDAGLTERMRAAQARLVDAYRAAGRLAEADAIAADLEQPLEPGGDLDLALDVELDAESHERPIEPDDDAPRSVDVVMDPPSARSPSDEQIEIAIDVTAAPPKDDALVIEALEIDLSDVLRTIGGTSPVPIVPASAPASSDPVPDLETVFEQMRQRVTGEQQDPATELLHRAEAHVLSDRVAEATRDFEAAARSPRYRFRAASMLGRLLIERGDLHRGIEWLERAAEAPAETPDEGLAVLYDLAGALERAGESARALAILMEIEADTAGYRDVRDRIDYLTRANA